MNKYYILRIAIISLFCFLFLDISYAQTNIETSLNNKFHRVLSFFKASEPGGTILVAKDGEIVYQKAFGKANLELNVDVKLNSKFGIASATKPFTAVAILKLVEDGKLSLKDDIRKFIKDYPTKGKTITIEHLLTHTSGIHNYNDNFQEFMKIEKNFYTNTAFIDTFKDKPSNFAPGEKYRYNNSAYFLLGYIIEIVSGKSYGEYLESEFFKPLRMNDTELNYSGKVIKNRANGYDLFSKEGYTNKRYSSDTFTASSTGGIISTVNDLYLWYEALMNYKVISKDLLEKAMTPYKLNNGKYGRTGLGWFTGNLLGSNYIAHDGRGWGAASSLIYLPKEKIFAVALSNCSYCSWDAGNFYYAPFRMASVLLEKDYYHGKSLNSKELQKYEAVYESDLGETKTIIADGNKLVLKHSNSRNSTIFAFKNDAFYIEDTYETLKFNKDSNGKVTSLTSNKVIQINFKRTNKKLPPKSLANAIYFEIIENGLTKGLQFFADNKDSKKYYLNESELNNVGYKLLRTNKTKQAVEIFKINTQNFPKSANAFDSLGEAYFVIKDYKKSLVNYQKSLKLNIKNENAKIMIKKIADILKI